MNYKVAIPSHKRNDLCQSTIDYLKSVLPYETEIYVFTSCDDYKIENAILIDSAPNGVQNIRNFIYKYFDENDKIVCIDDSFTGLLKKQSGKLFKFENYHDLIKIGFAECFAKKTILFGVNLVENPFFMTKKIQFGNYPISGKFHGVIIKKKYLFSNNPFGLAEDQELSLRVTENFRGVVRFGTITFNKPQYGLISGGIQDMYTNEQRKKIEEKSHKYLSKKFSTLCSYKADGVGLKYKTITK
jgi:hypothetical protein